MDLPSSQELESDTQWQKTWRPLPDGAGSFKGGQRPAGPDPTQARQTASPHPPPGLHTQAWVGLTQPCFPLFPSDRLADSYFPKTLVTSPSLVVVAGLIFFFSNFLLLFPADLTFHAQGQITH